jgi:hypothetical protein
MDLKSIDLFFRMKVCRLKCKIIRKFANLKTYNVKKNNLRIQLVNILEP